MKKIIGKILILRQHRCQSPLGQSPVSDFTPTWRTNTPHLTVRKRGKIIVVYKALALLYAQSVQHLFLPGGTQGSNGQYLGLPPAE